MSAKPAASSQMSTRHCIVMTALIHPGEYHSPAWALPLRSFSLTTPATSAPERREPIPGSPGPASSQEGVSVGLRRPLKYSRHLPTILGRGQQHTIPTGHSVDSALPPLPLTLDGGPKPFQSRLDVTSLGQAQPDPMSKGLATRPGSRRGPR